MSLVQAYNVVLFRSGATPSSPACALTLDQPWKLSAGLKPDVNQATMPFTEFQKIADLNATGQVEFYFTADPSAGGKPDFIMAGVRIIDIEPLSLANVQTVPGHTAVQFAEYRVCFVDFREGFQAPRGGRLCYGPINMGSAGQPGPANSPTSSYSPPEPPLELNMAQLCTLCLSKMGLAIPAGGLPATLNNVNAPRNLKWFGNHAPGELEKLLTAAGHVFCPHLDGTYSIEQPLGSILAQFGKPPGGGAYASIAAGNSSKIDQRGRYCAITSAPTRAISTQTITGPGEGLFEYVVQSYSTGDWVTIDSVWGSDEVAGRIYNAWLSGGWEGVQAIKAGGNVPPNLPADAWDIGQVDQIFSFIRISSTLLRNKELSPVLGRRFEADGSDHPIQVIATGAAVGGPGVTGWTTAAGPVTFDVLHRIDGNVLFLHAPAFTLDQSGFWWGIRPGNMTVRCSFEQNETNPAAQADTTGAEPPLIGTYYSSGWASAAAGTSQLDADATQEILDGQTIGALILDHPELRLLIVDGNEINRAALDTVAQMLAAVYLKPAVQQATTQAVVGFASIQPSGAISSVEWDQKDVKTTAHVLDYYTAAAAVGIHDIRKLYGGTGSGQAASEAHPHQAKTQSSRESLGASGNSPAVLPLMPSPPRPVLGLPVWVWSTGGIAGQGGAYNGMVLTDPSAVTIESGIGGVQIDFGSIKGTACILIVPAENDRTTHNLPTQRLVMGSPAPSLSAQLGLAPRIPTYWVDWDPDAIRDIGWDPVNHLLRDATVTDPQPADWKTITPFVDCAMGT
ncbi:MAG TPA: hypothetical protein VHY37_10575 [Tepidisphaeraceae bacterium]|jgi:hypothetical protein|nr:hypothetical protein [Tepidisphaeraceae bacterium]